MDNDFLKLLKEARAKHTQIISAIDVLISSIQNNLTPTPYDGSDNLYIKDQKSDNVSGRFKNPTKGMVVEFINSTPNPITMRKLYDHFEVPKKNKLNFAAMIRTLRDSKMIGCVKYSNDNMKTYYGRADKLGPSDFLNDYKTELMKEFTNPEILLKE